MSVIKTAGEKDVVAQSRVEWDIVSIHGIDMGNAFIILFFIVQVDGRVQFLGMGHCGEWII